MEKYIESKYIGPLTEAGTIPSFWDFQNPNNWEHRVTLHEQGEIETVYYEKDEYIGPLVDGQIPSTYWDDPNYWTVKRVEKEETSTDE